MEHRRILVVDDDPVVRDCLRESLEYEGYEAVEASNGQEALDYLRKNPAPCLVLLDLMMPVMNGYDFLDAVRKDPGLGSISVLIVSAADRANVEKAARDSGAVGFLFKPLKLKPLLKCVEKFC